MNDDLRIDWNQGLVPVIIQDAHTLTVLMLGYMNQAAFAQTQREGLVTFYSRSKQRLWTKGESSGHHLKVVSMHVDCDRDALLIRVHPQGPTCHTGTESCFDAHARVPREGLGFIPELDRIIEQRLRTPQASSYTARLAAEGMARMAQKVGEEGLEIALAAVSGSKTQVVEESADLIFHWLLLLKAQQATVYEVLDVLSSRQTKAPRSEATSLIQTWAAVKKWRGLRGALRAKPKDYGDAPFAATGIVFNPARGNAPSLKPVMC